MKKLTCNICGCPAKDYFLGSCECNCCNSISTVNMPSEDELIEFYNNFNKNYKGGAKEGSNLMKYARRYLSLTKRYCNGGSIIDIGSSTSPFPNLAVKNGFDVTITDYIKPDNLDSKINYFYGTLNSEEFLKTIKKKFDIVSAWAVIEHVSNPKLAFSIISKLCKKNGFIFLSTPEIGTNLTNFSMGASAWYYPPMHLHLISPKAIQHLCNENDCKLIYWGRIEFSTLRFVLRYSIGLLESFIGFFFKLFFKKKWEDSKVLSTHRFKGITYFVIQKN